MLGWEIIIDTLVAARTPGDPPAKTLATWKAGFGGLDWLKPLVASGDAVDIGGNGYPDRYSVKAGALLAVLRQGLPEHESPPIIGDDYALPSGWRGDARIDFDRLTALPAEQELIVEAWDAS